ncbi:MAG: oligosaccharide flippase family protein [Sulfurovum sp.]|nr:oligosaccharide flippase family protein [Sulfurovum sp.]
MTHLINLSLRGLSILGKLLILLFITKYLSVEQLGVYGLFLTSITLVLYLLGMDFYMFNTREILAQQHDNQLQLIRDQFVFHFIMYIIILPLLFVFFIYNILPNEYMLYFYLIVIFEHLSQEFFRLFITLSHQVLANIILFIRTAFWAYILIALWFFGLEDVANLLSIFLGWFLGALVSVLIAFLYLQKIYHKNKKLDPINWKWIRNGFYISLPFFIGTIGLKLIEFSDRYMIDYYMIKDDVGIYIFFSSIANIMIVFVSTLVTMVYYPKLISYYQNQDKINYENTLQKFYQYTLIVTLIASIGIIGLIHPLLTYIDKAQFYEQIEVLWLLICANFFFNLSTVPHFVLFAMKKDILIRNITLFAAIINIGFNFLLITTLGLIGAAIATSISFLTIYIIKYLKVKEYA